MTEKKFYNKVCFAAFLFSLMVVMIHSYNADMFLTLPAEGGAAEVVWQFQHILADVLGPVAVPGFFMLSAYQFYRKCSYKDIGPKMERRIRTVLLPYLLWNFLYYLGYAAAGRIPYLAGISDKTAVELYCIKNLIQIPIVNMDALFYYSAAAYGALHAEDFLEERQLQGRKGTAVRAAAAVLGTVLAVYFYQGITVRHSVFETVLYRFTVPVTLWMAVPGMRLPDAREWMKYGFFLYTIHFILARGINKLGAALLPHSALTALLLYLAIPVICVILAWKLGEFLRKYAGPLWRVISGGR